MRRCILCGASFPDSTCECGGKIFERIICLSCAVSGQRDDESEHKVKPIPDIAEDNALFLIETIVLGAVDNYRDAYVDAIKSTVKYRSTVSKEVRVFTELHDSFMWNEEYWNKFMLGRMREALSKIRYSTAVKLSTKEARDAAQLIEIKIGGKKRER